MAITYVGNGATDDEESDTTLVLPYPAGIAVDDFAIAFFYKNNTGATYTIPAGWTAIDDTTGFTTAMYRRYGGAEGSNETFVLSTSARQYGIMCAYRGCLKGDEFDVAAEVSDTDAAATTTQGATVTTTRKNATLVMFFLGQDGSDYLNITYPSGHTSRFEDNNVQDEAATEALIAINDGIQAAVGASGALDYGHDSLSDNRRLITIALKNGNLNKSHLAIGVL